MITVRGRFLRTADADPTERSDLVSQKSFTVKLDPSDHVGRLIESIEFRSWFRQSTGITFGLGKPISGRDDKYAPQFVHGADRYRVRVYSGHTRKSYVGSEDRVDARQVTVEVTHIFARANPMPSDERRG